MKEGHDFQRILLAPTIEQLLKLRKDELVLEIACGNGNFARRMAQLGARVVTFDFREEFIQRARARPTQGSERMVEISLMNVFA